MAHANTLAWRNNPTSIGTKALPRCTILFTRPPSSKCAHRERCAWHTITYSSKHAGMKRRASENVVEISSTGTPRFRRGLIKPENARVNCALSYARETESAAKARTMMRAAQKSPAPMPWGIWATTVHARMNASGAMHAPILRNEIRKCRSAATKSRTNTPNPSHVATKNSETEYANKPTRAKRASSGVELCCADMSMPQV